jgi:hypothetical protein
MALSSLFPTIGFQIIIESRSTEDFPGLEIDKCLVRHTPYRPAGKTQNLFSGFIFTPCAKPPRDHAAKRAAHDNKCE